MRLFPIFMVILILATHAGSPSHGETALERVLAMVEANPALQGSNTFINLASQAPQAQVDSVISLDSSVVINRNVPVSSDGLAEPLELQIETMALGATNTGRVRVLGVQSPATGAASGIFVTANAATTRSPVLAPVAIISNAPISDSSAIKTKAIGAMNTGAIQIVVQSDGTR